MGIILRTLAAASCIAATAPALAATYEVVDIAPYVAHVRRHSDNDGIAINNAGEIAGTAYTESGPLAFIYRSGALQYLGTLGSSDSYAAAINARGDVAGHSSDSDAHDTVRPFLWNGRSMKDLGSLGGPFAFAYGVNKARQVAGFSYLTSGSYRAFLYSHGSMQDLGTLGGTSSAAYGINDAGVVVGFAANSDGLNRAFKYSQGTMTELGTLGGGPTSSSVALAINQGGLAVGWSKPDWGSSFHAVRFDAGGATDLGTLGGAYSSATAVNTRGDIVGWSTSQGTGNSPGAHKAVLFRDGRVILLAHRLDPLTGAGWRLIEATGINDKGQIVGWGEHDGAYRIYLLNPMGELGAQRQP